jgi:hypothetical protein
MANEILKIRFWFAGFKGRMKGRLWWVKFRFGTCLWFFKLAWLSLRGKVMIIDSKEVYSNGGFKYLQVNLSEKPVNKNADYSKW